MQFTSINPYTSDQFAEYPVHSDIQVGNRLRIADKAFTDWSRWSFADRADCFRRLADVLRTKQPELARLITGEMGKTLAESRAEIDKCAGQCLYYADHAEEMLRPG